MENKNNTLMGAAMAYGVSLGVFWVIKYLFYMFSLNFPFLVFIYWGMSLMVPYFAYVLTKRYRTDLGGSISFAHAWLFGILLYFFAAVIVSLMHYVFYRYVAPPDFVKTTVEQTIASLQEVQVDQRVIDTIKSLNITPIQLALQGILNNLFYGVIFSIPVAAIVCRGNRSDAVGKQ